MPDEGNDVGVLERLSAPETDVGAETRELINQTLEQAKGQDASQLGGRKAVVGP
jgi:hypothetical protein